MGVMHYGYNSCSINQRKSKTKGEPGGSPFFLRGESAYCFLSSMLPFTLLALRSRPPLPIFPEA